VVLIGHAGHPEVEGTMGQYDTAMAGRSTWSRTSPMSRPLQVRHPETLSYVTQTTLSVDDTAR
jgi:4-hydroxy-3-methylbut-2-enyl diphosphate reductase